MRLFRVQPRHRVHQYSAPSIYTEAMKDEEAIKQAQVISRLGDYPDWTFSVTGSFDTNKKRKSRNDD